MDDRPEQATNPGERSESLSHHPQRQSAVKFLVSKSYLLAVVCLFTSPALWAQTPVNPAKPVKFGALAIFTGDAAFTGEICRNAMRLAEEEVNQSGGIRGRELRIIFEDFGPFDMKKAASAGQKLIAIDHVAALFPFWTEDTEIVAPMAEKARVPLMASWPGGVNISKLGRYVFRSTTSDSVLLERLMRYSLAQGKKRMCMVHADSAYFENVADASHAVAAELQASIETIRVSGDTDDFRTLALKLKQQGCESIMTIVPHKSLAPLVRAVRQIKLGALLLGPSYLDYEEARRVLGSEAGDFVFARYEIADEKFNECYRRRFGADSQRPAGNCYDAVKVMSYVMERHGFEFEAVNRGLRALTGYQGVTGPFTIAANNDRFGESVVLYRLAKDAVSPVE